MTYHNYYNILQVGTVLNAMDAKNAINAGAKFLMSPAIVMVPFKIVKISIFFCYHNQKASFSFLMWHFVISIQMYRYMMIQKCT